MISQIARRISEILTWLMIMFLLSATLIHVSPAISQAANAEDVRSAEKQTPAESARQELKDRSLQQLAASNARFMVPELIDRAYRRGEITAELRLLYLAYAVYDSQKLPLAYQSNQPWWGTQVVRELRQAQSNLEHLELSSQVRSELDRLLSPEAATVCDQNDSEFNYDSAHFHINYSTITELTIEDYAEALETTFSTEVTSYDWAEPPLCTEATCKNDNPWDLYPIHVGPLGTGLYGYTTSGGGKYTGEVGDNTNTSDIETEAYASCMVLNADYTAFPGGAWFSLSVTAAHEYVHSIQFGVGDPGDAEDLLWWESIAAYMEDEVYDESNDNYQYLYPDLTSCLGEFSGNVYSYWLLFRYAAEHNGGTNVPGGGEDIAQKLWQYVSVQSQSGLVAYHNALATKGTNLPQTFHDFAIATRFMLSCPFAAPYCYEEAAGYLSSEGGVADHGSIPTPTGEYSGLIQDNYSINYIGLPASGTFTITLQNQSTGGQLWGSIVAETASGLSVTHFPELVNGGETTRLVRYSPPEGTTQLVAVLTNQAQTADNPSRCTAHPYRLSLVEEIQPETFYTYLPGLVFEELLAARGRVTDQGVGVAGAWVDLWYNNGSTYSLYDTQVTDADGYYAFPDLPVLADEEQYFSSRWENPGTEGWLKGWDCQLVYMDSPASAGVCNFDLADIALLSPANGVTADLPQNFQFTPRPATPGDSYEFNLYDDRDYAPWWWTDPALGYVGDYSLDSLPAGFAAGVQYTWDIWVYGENGYGISSGNRKITFNGPAGAITGQVHLAGSPVPDVEVELFGGVYSAQATTDLEGYYQFSGVPSLGADQFYLIRYINDEEISGRVWFWVTPTLEAYTQGYAYQFPVFDIGDVELISPADGAAVSLPWTFQWAVRPATPSDTYEFNLYDPDDGIPWWWSYPSLGYTGSYTLNSLPDGFLINTTYKWEIWVYAPDGGFGESYNYYDITFTSSGLLNGLKNPLTWTQSRLRTWLPPRK